MLMDHQPPSRTKAIEWLIRAGIGIAAAAGASAAGMALQAHTEIEVLKAQRTADSGRLQRIENILDSWNRNGVPTRE